MEKLTWVLWRERELLEALLYRLELEAVVMSTGRTRWLANAANDVDAASAALRDIEVAARRRRRRGRRGRRSGRPTPASAT